MKIRFFVVLLCIAAVATTAQAGGVCNTPPSPSADVVQVGYSSFHLFDPLSNDSDADGDPLVLTSIASPPACAGSLQIDGPLVRFTPNGSSLPGDATFCTASYWLSDGHDTRQGSVTLLFPPAAIFSDGFESGNTTAWDETVPGS